MTCTNTAHIGNVCVLGIGKTGEAACRYLSGLMPGRVDSVTLFGGVNSRESEQTRALGAAGVRCVLGTEEVEGEFDLAVVSPGIPETSAFYRAAAACSAEVISEVELAFRESPANWLAVTGTNGKTTTTSLTTHLLSEAGLSAESVGNIGVLCIEEAASRPYDGWFVTELSSFQLASSPTLRPHAAVLLNVTPDHIEWHGSMEAYAAAKEKVFANMGTGDLAVVSVDDDWCRDVAVRCSGRGLRVCELSVERELGGPDAAFERGGRLVVRLSGVEHDICSVDDLRIRGSHNWENALAASALALFMGIDAEKIASGLATFSPIEHRIEPCGEAAGIHFVNDSKATNTDSVEKALTAFDAGTVVVLLGGHDKGTDLASLSRACCARARVAVCFGEAGPRMAASLKDEAAASGSALEIVCADHLRDAFAAACAEAREGDTVLLSPACSSFDEFSNMAERGRLFKSLATDYCRAHDASGAGE
ncbi:UDP-N-acetylmuramoyl-L-alanine--D-glutamate ligase [Paratractidigestivibacter sp.]|uniref:UDP-N-acetylmuramoyl-L-alanine--D-glutamate ligase n=1 Tax=Paratractidigestivibacter sp. TaxID=2847316 RepID=UPI002ACB1486|nr:UDP-N-acetylmuramoyl-L-alanine--D-glutamate ligase [Paratractidigestivibacter sp.]